MRLLTLPPIQSRSQEGSATIIVLAMLAIMLIFISVNTVAVRGLGRELKLLEKKQVQRIQSAPRNQPGLHRPDSKP